MDCHTGTYIPPITVATIGVVNSDPDTTAPNSPSQPNSPNISGRPSYSH